MTEKANYLESQTRRNNLVVDGIPEAQNESWKETEDKVMCVINEKLHLDSSQMMIERVHRTGNPTGYSGKRPRPIMIKFLRYKDKMAVLGKAKKPKGTNIYVNEDYTESVRQKRRELIPVMKAARERGDIAYIRHDKLIVHPPFQKYQKSTNGQELELETSFSGLLNFVLI